MKKALITGITGQDGSYLAEFLLAKSNAVDDTGALRLLEPRQHALLKRNGFKVSVGRE